VEDRNGAVEEKSTCDAVVAERDVCELKRRTEPVEGTRKKKRRSAARLMCCEFGLGPLLVQLFLLLVFFSAIFLR
jgi:hypothetical protein